MYFQRDARRGRERAMAATHHAKKRSHERKTWHGQKKSEQNKKEALGKPGSNKQEAKGF